jgi:hypothetical protein
MLGNAVLFLSPITSWAMGMGLFVLFCWRGILSRSGPESTIELLEVDEVFW